MTAFAPAVLGSVLSVDPIDAPAGQGREAAFVVLVAFLVSFAFIRTSARLTRSVSWWPGSVKTSGGLTLHHLVWGIVLLLVTGFLALAVPAEASPWWQITAAAFGIGAGLTLDEFALWTQLRDVYWSQEGRSSLDAVIFAAIFLALVVIGTQPFGLDEPASVLGTAALAAQAIGLAVVAFLKGRLWLGAAALFIPFLGLWPALRLAHPGSPWARRVYARRHPEKLERARARFAPDRLGPRLRTAFVDAIGGRPSDPRDA